MILGGTIPWPIFSAQLRLHPLLPQVVLHPGDVVVAVLEVAGGDDLALQRDRGFDAFDHELAEGSPHAADGDVARGIEL